LGWAAYQFLVLYFAAVYVTNITNHLFFSRYFCKVKNLHINKQMKKEEFIVANLKCGGCANTIKKAITATKGVKEVLVDVDNSAVAVECNEEVDRRFLAEKLNGLGYPEATEKNGLLAQIRSYGSCLTGKFSND
jgi:copper chaperone